MINYAHIAKAVSFYESAGYKFIDVPWAVSEKAVRLTAPTNSVIYPHENEFLVASGEQGFIQLMLEKKLSPGKWGCVTACFRDDARDKWHQKYFLKVELIDTLDTTVPNLAKTVGNCLSFFQTIIPRSIVIGTHPRDPLLRSAGYDIIALNGIELGSYGVREHLDVGRWIYATGCAEPRLSLALKEQSIDSQGAL